MQYFDQTALRIPMEDERMIQENSTNKKDLISLISLITFTY